MAYEALDSLQQTLTQILKRDDHLITRRVKRDIISIHDKAIALQLNLKAFPEKETMREVASTTLEIIEYLFSPENLSDCGSIEPSVGVSKQLRELAEELDLIVGDVVDNCKVNDVRQQRDYPALSGLSQRLESLAEKILSSPRDLADYSRSNDDSVNKVRRLNDSSRSAPTSNDVAVGIDEDLSYSAADAVSSSSRPAPTSNNFVAGIDEDLSYSATDDDSDSSVRRLNDSPRSAPTSNNAVVGSDKDLSYSPADAVSSSSRPAPTSNYFVMRIDSDLSFSATDDDSDNSLRRLNDSPRSAPTSKNAVVGSDENLSYSPADAVSSSSRPAPTSNNFVVGIDEDLSYSAAGAVSSSSRPAPTIKDGVVVGFEEDLIQILDRLTGGLRDTQVLSIVGMGGIGKTTLAKIVYDHPMITKHFDVRGWVTVSQDFSRGIICSNLLASMKGKRIQAERCADEISDSLVLKKYLIVLDDIWSMMVWEEMRNLFPNNYNGSWILLTTRLHDLAAHISSFCFSRDIHMMRFLDEQQSWHLFQRKVFADQTCPLELQSVAKKIVTSCGGLPLSIVTVAEQLSNIDRTPRLWEQIVATDGDGRLESIFSSSYNHLPQHLKACFLYMAGFPEEYEIRVSELIKLWVAEGFIVERQYRSKILEEMAEEYLRDLVEESLLLVTSTKTDGKIRSCILQNNVRDFCVRQAGQKKFLLPVMDYLPTPILRRHFLPQVLKNHRRISATWYDLDLKDSMHSSCTHSIICIPQKGYRPKGSVRNFSSLRVLHVLRRDDHLYWELGQVFDLIHLTYLASNIPSSIVPPAISKLQNLQTLIIYRSGVRLPMEIWSLRKLRHLIAFSFDPLPHPEAAALPLNNLQTLSLATDFVCSGRMVEMIPNTKKLGICYAGEKFDEVYHFDNLAHLRRLEKLKLEMRSWPFWPSLSRPVFPVSLKKLTLSGCRLPWRDMTIIGSLPKLQVLRLRNYAFDGERWETTDGEFPSLRLLLIDESNVQHWESNCSHFPLLECLKLQRCPYLSEIPRDLGEIPTLELIEVDDLSLFNSAKMKRGNFKRSKVILTLKYSV